MCGVAFMGADELLQRGPLPPPPPPPPAPLSEDVMMQAAAGRCIPTPSSSDTTYTIVRAGASNDATSHVRSTEGRTCGDGKRGFVAMITPCTSRKAGFISVRKSPFAKNYLPSAVDTLSRSAEAGLDVVFYVGYDVRLTGSSTNLNRRNPKHTPSFEFACGVMQSRD